MQPCACEQLLDGPTLMLGFSVDDDELKPADQVLQSRLTSFFHQAWGCVQQSVVRITKVDDLSRLAPAYRAKRRMTGEVMIAALQAYASVIRSMSRHGVTILRQLAVLDSSIQHAVPLAPMVVGSGFNLTASGCIPESLCGERSAFLVLKGAKP